MREKKKLLITSNYFFSYSVLIDLQCRHMKTTTCLVKAEKQERNKRKCCSAAKSAFLSFQKHFLFHGLYNRGLFGTGLTLSQTTNFRSSKLKEFADDNLKVEENTRKFSKWIEDTVEKGQIARYEQFLLFPQCFQDLHYRHVKTRVCLGKG